MTRAIRLAADATPEDAAPSAQANETRSPFLEFAQQQLQVLEAVLRAPPEVAREFFALAETAMRYNLEAFQLLHGGKRSTPPAADAGEQEILALFQPGTLLTGQEIAEQLGHNELSGPQRTRLAAMTRKGLLVNLRPGYALPAEGTA